MARISRTKAIETVENSTGKFLGLTFTKKNGETRNINGKYTGKTTKDGYLVIKERGGTFKNVNTQTLSGLRVNKQTYKVAQ